ncbi:polymorphic toxin-type HINT domain-containing protein [Micromonospora violae]|uniref:polymorphic toxin-type HINT domain-containing protein n=1 Tax=Micromonospora violae TaxID=1278207 RepID=UPI0034104902
MQQTPLVVLADGDRKPIEELKVDDQVLTTDPETGQTTTREVTDTHTNNDTDLTDLAVTTHDGKTSTIKTTQHHPFWSQTRHQWVDAADLQPGEQLLTPDKGHAMTVTGVRSYAGAKVMYDLTVAEIHTYYVLAGDTPVLVHNCNDPRVVPGAYHMLDRAEEGAVNHLVPGIGANEAKICSYLCRAKDFVPKFRDTRSNADIAIDNGFKGGPVVVVQQKHMVHAYQAEAAYVERQLASGNWELK